jgi:hypothetical protein
MLTGRRTPIHSHEFTNREDASRFLRYMVRSLTAAHVEEIFSHSTTSFRTMEMVNSHRAAYSATVEYCIDVA